MKLNTYYYITTSNAAPFFSDTDNGFVEEKSPMKALRAVVGKYRHPAGLYAAQIRSAEVNSKVLAEYLSARAHTSMCAACGSHETRNGHLYVNGRKAREYREIFREFTA